MTEIPDTYDPATVERRWREQWADSDVYRYEDTDAPDYVVDTPPPYPTGNLHIGNALGWCYMDFAARHRRMVGHDVCFPQGWDCHGLPTEVKVEENHGIHRTDVSREEFRDLCIEHTERMIAEMTETMHTLGFSQDWSREYRTMDPDYWAKTQRSFVEMADGGERTDGSRASSDGASDGGERTDGSRASSGGPPDDGYVYRDEHPVNWCPRCETAIADAEVETIDREGTLHYVTFPGVGNADVEIATTRPELLAACVAVAVHPDDDRYAGRVGDVVEVPLFGHEVEILADEAVDADFGSGAVMVCTFGDKQDVDWWAEHDLPLRPVFTEDGRLVGDGDEDGEEADEAGEYTDALGEYAGLTIDAAHDRIAEDLDAGGYLTDTETVDQSVGACWRCDTPIEILSTEQWFVEVRQDEILAHAREVEWIPEHMYTRLEEWTEGMDWDWVVSRQRVFATPIPAWFCDDCGYTYVASVDEVPVDPTDEDPAVEECPECGASEWTGETDVMDTWMDSSISALHVAGWPDAEFEPVQLREQGHDIIRTWAFYTLLRTAALADDRPWDEALINGMVFGEDGHKMSKSRGNFVQPEEVVEEYGADAFRQAMALGGQPGSDVQFQWKEVRSAAKFLTKVWNIARFAADHVDADTPDIEAPAYRDADAWLLARLSEVAESVDDHAAAYRFDAALREVREFVWHDLADDYIELVKGRLYDGRPGERDAARHALYTALSASVRMLAPFAPFVAEELYDHLPGVDGSVHVADWPAPDAPDDEDAAAGAAVAEVARAVRAWKSGEGIPLNEAVERVEVYLEDDLTLDQYDLSEAVGGPIYVDRGRPAVEAVPVDVAVDHTVVGPEFRDRAGAVASALESADPAEVQAQLDRSGEVEVQVNGEVLVVEGDAVTVETEYRAEGGEGEAVEVMETESATVLVFP